MTAYRKKPVVIEATEWRKNGDHPADNASEMFDYPDGCRRPRVIREGSVVRYFRHPDVGGDTACKHCGVRMHEHGWIDTLEGGHIVCPGDMVITGVKGERYPCKPDIFAATYESAALQGGDAASEAAHHGLDTDERVCFYEQDFYVLSNFSSFTLAWKTGPYMCQRFPTSEQAYHWEKFNHLGGEGVQRLLDDATSAHEAFGIAQKHKGLRRADWDDVKIDLMRRILRAKADQHEYVRRKLLATGDRELVENSWRDDYWGWGPNRDGKNMLGRLWMEVRAELRATAPKAHGGRNGE